MADNGNKDAGFNLETRVFSDAKQQGYRFVVGDILAEPINNDKSMTFHQGIGFTKIGIVRDDELTWTLVCREL